MSLSPELALIFREEVRRALGLVVTPATVGQDAMTVLAALPLHDSRVFASRLHDAALEFLVQTDPGLTPEPTPEPTPTEPGPAAPPAPEPPDEPAPAEAVADPQQAEDAA